MNELGRLKAARLALITELDAMPAFKRGSRWEADRLAELVALGRAIARRERAGRRSARLDRLNERLFERENYEWPGTRAMDILRSRHVKVMAARAALRPAPAAPFGWEAV